VPPERCGMCGTRRIRVTKCEDLFDRLDAVTHLKVSEGTGEWSLACYGDKAGADVTSRRAMVDCEDCREWMRAADAFNNTGAMGER